MNKPFKVLTSASIAAIFASTAIVPVAAADLKSEAPLSIDEVIFNYDGKENLKLSFEDYREAYSAGVLAPQGVKYIQGDNGKFYSFADYREAFAAKGDSKEALALLEPIELKADTVKEGKVDTESKKVVAKEDAQPEDRLNETFFYNAA